MSVSATQFRIDLKNLLAGVNAGENYDIVKHSTVIGRLVPGNMVAKPDMTISATNVRVKFKDVIAQLNTGSTYHILKHKRVLAALVPAGYAASTVDIETVEDEAYNATNDAMDALSEDMNPVTPEIPASEQTFTPSGYRLDTLTPIVEDETDMSADTDEQPDDGLDTLTVNQLYSYAEKHDIAMPSPRRPKYFRKYDVKAFIRAALNERRAGQDTDDIEVSDPVSVVEHTIDEFENDSYNKLDTLTMKELHSFAAKNDIEMPPMLRKSEVKAVIREALDKRGGHDYLDAQHDDEYDAFFADLQERGDLRDARRNRTT
jgi:antitoxin (DNA-binding transcriptional repressor) of toxin-antitoxin stability system